MAKTRDVLAVFNRGRISRLAVARTDVSRVALSAETQTNWVPRTLGPMMLRPGMEWIVTASGNAVLLPFVYSTSDSAVIELASNLFRVLKNGDTRVDREAVTATITNGTFASDISGWTDDDDAGATSSWDSGGYMQLLGDGFNYARRYQEVTVTGGEENTNHGLRIVIERGPVVMRIGSTAGDDDLFPQAILRTGTHSINVDPDGNSSFFIDFESAKNYPVLIDSVSIESSGAMEVPTPWGTQAVNRTVRWQQSGDVIFCASDGYQQRRIERRTNDSWSCVLYGTDDGPFLTENLTPITLTPSAISGEITITASQAYFKSTHVGALLRLDSVGQRVEVDASAAGTWSDPIRVTGVGNDRIFSVIRAGTWNATVTLQRSVGDVGSWVDVATYTTNATVNYDDGLDNSIIYYRIGIDTGDYTSGTAELALEYSSGSIAGVCRITGFTSSTVVDAVVLTNLGGLDETTFWREGSWSDLNGWPTSVAIYEGRLWWQGRGRNWGSVSDAFETFDPDYEGDAGPINRSIGEGPANSANWAMPLQRLIVGTDGGEYTIRSNSFDEPVTPSNYNSRAPSTKGSTQAPAQWADGRGYFIGRDTVSVYELEYDAGRYDFAALDLTLLVPEIGEETFVRIGVQQEPDLRLHCVRADGTVAIMVRDAAEDVLAWFDVETDGNVLDVVVLPGEIEDKVFYLVQRDIAGLGSRTYIEQWAREDQCVGGTVNRQADSFVVGSGSTSTITGLSHLEGESVVVWADGEDKGTFTVSSGQIDVGETVTQWCVGLPYTATYKSAKLAGQTNLGLSLTQRSRINKIGLILADVHAQGLEFGPDFTTMDNLPGIEDEAAVDADAVRAAYDEDMITFPGEWSTDNRICLRATAPRPVKVLAAVLNVDRQDHE